MADTMRTIEYVMIVLTALTIVSSETATIRPKNPAVSSAAVHQVDHNRT